MTLSTLKSKKVLLVKNLGCDVRCWIEVMYGNEINPVASSDSELNDAPAPAGRQLLTLTHLE